MTNQPGATADDPLHVKRSYPSRRTRVVGGEPVDPVHQLRPVGGVGAGRPPLRWRRRGWWWGWGRGQGRGVLQLIDQGIKLTKITPGAATYTFCATVGNKSAGVTNPGGTVANVATPCP